MSNEYPQEFQYLLFFAALSGRVFNKSELGIVMTIKEIDQLIAQSALLNVASKGKTRLFSARPETFEWAGANLKFEMPGKNKAVLRILDFVRARADAFLRANQVTFADFAATAVIVPTRKASGSGATDGVRQAYLAVSGGVYEVRVLLKDLRKHLEFPRQAQDEAFLELIRSGEADFYPEDDPMSRDAEDDEAALQLADRRRHLMYLHPTPRT